MSVVYLDGPGFASLAEEILDKGHLLRFQAQGGSMWPVIRRGDILEIQPWRGEAPRVGESLLLNATAGASERRGLVGACWWSSCGLAGEPGVSWIGEGGVSEP